MEMSVPSFYVLSEGHTAVPSSHDTSRAQFHHQDLAAFAEDVNSVGTHSNLAICCTYRLILTRLPRGLFQTAEGLDMKQLTSVLSNGRTMSLGFNKNLVP